MFCFPVLEEDLEKWAKCANVDPNEKWLLRHTAGIYYEPTDAASYIIFRSNKLPGDLGSHAGHGFDQEKSMDYRLHYRIYTIIL